MLRGTGRLRTAAWRETGENVSSALCVREAKDLSEGKSYAGFAVSEPGQLSAMPVQWQQYTTWPCPALLFQASLQCHRPHINNFASQVLQNHIVFKLTLAKGMSLWYLCHNSSLKYLSGQHRALSKRLQDHSWLSSSSYEESWGISVHKTLNMSQQHALAS